MPPVDSRECQNLLLHLGKPSSSYVNDPLYCASDALQLLSVNPYTLECILKQQQQQLTMVLATQQQTMMTSFQQMFIDILASHTTAANDTPAHNHDLGDYSQSRPQVESDNDLLSLDAEVQEHLENYYVQIEFLDEMSAAIHDHLQQNYYTSSHPRVEDEITPNTGNGDNWYCYNEDFHSSEADAKCCDDFQEFQDDEGNYEESG